MNIFQPTNVILFNDVKQHRTLAKQRTRGLTRDFIHCGTVLGLLKVRAETVRNAEHRNKGLYVRYTILRALELAQTFWVFCHICGTLLLIR